LKQNFDRLRRKSNPNLKLPPKGAKAVNDGHYRKFQLKNAFKHLQNYYYSGDMRMARTYFERRVKRGVLSAIASNKET
jgi:hypothetical protein